MHVVTGRERVRPSLMDLCRIGSRCCKDKRCNAERSVIVFSYAKTLLCCSGPTLAFFLRKRLHVPAPDPAQVHQRRTHALSSRHDMHRRPLLIAGQVRMTSLDQCDWSRSERLCRLGFMRDARRLSCRRRFLGEAGGNRKGFPRNQAKHDAASGKPARQRDRKEPADE